MNCNWSKHGHKDPNICTLILWKSTNKLVCRIIIDGTNLPNQTICVSKILPNLPYFPPWNVNHWPQYSSSLLLELIIPSPCKFWPVIIFLPALWKDSFCSVCCERDLAEPKSPILRSEFTLAVEPWCLARLTGSGDKRDFYLSPTYCTDIRWFC